VSFFTLVELSNPTPQVTMFMSHLLGVPITSAGPETGAGLSGGDAAAVGGQFVTGGDLPAYSGALQGGVTQAVKDVYIAFLKEHGLSSQYDVDKPADQAKIEEKIACQDKRMRRCRGCGGWGCVGAGRLGLNSFPQKRCRYSKCLLDTHACSCLSGGDFGSESQADAANAALAGGGGSYALFNPFVRPNPKSSSPAFYGVPASDYNHGSLVAGKRGFWRALPGWGPTGKWVKAHKFGSMSRYGSYAALPPSLRKYCVPGISCAHPCGTCGSSYCGGCGLRSKHAKALAKAKQQKSVYDLWVEAKTASAAFHDKVNASKTNEPVLHKTAKEAFDALKAAADALLKRLKNSDAKVQEAARDESGIDGDVAAVTTKVAKAAKVAYNSKDDDATAFNVGFNIGKDPLPAKRP
jgi:hypothetical protein